MVISNLEDPPKGDGIIYVSEYETKDYYTKDLFPFCLHDKILLENGWHLDTIDEDKFSLIQWVTHLEIIVGVEMTILVVRLGF